jgi:hypothetical protein
MNIQELNPIFLPVDPFKRYMGSEGFRGFMDYHFSKKPSSRYAY